VTVTANRTSGAASSDPDILVLRLGNTVAVADGVVNNSETLVTNLAAGEHVIAVTEAANAFSDTGGTDVCFVVTIG